VAITTVITHATGDVFPATDWNTYLRDNINYLIAAGANLASAATVVPTNEFHIVTGAVTIDNLSPATPVVGQQHRLLFQSALMIRNNGGGTGNIRTVTGADRPTLAGEVVSFQWDGTVWREAGFRTWTWRKSTAKIVNTTVSAVDLLNGELTIPAGILGTTGTLRLTAWGTWTNASGSSTVAPPRFGMAFGGTTLYDTGAVGQVSNSVNRHPWRVVIELINLGVTNNQYSSFQVLATCFVNLNASAAFFTSTQGGNTVVNSIAGVGNFHAQGAGDFSGIDTATAKALTLFVINGSASATYETKLGGALAEVV
jgi:adhesin HecA-like repeat protein